MPRLEVEEKGQHRVVDFTETIVIGREQSNGLVIHDPASSRRHCRLTREAGAYYLEDLKSSNGTLLNGRRASKIEIAEGDRIEVGEVAITFRAADVAPAADEPVVESPIVEPPTPVPSVLEEEPAANNGAAPQVEIVGGDGPVEIRDTPFNIGRRAGNHLVVADKRVSGLHAKIERRGAQWVIEDCGSGNGLFIGKEKVDQQRLLNGMEITLGSTQLRFDGFPEVEDMVTPPAARTMPAEAPVDADFDGQEAFQRIDVEAVPTSPLQVVWTILFLLFFVAILFSGGLLVQHRMNEGKVEFDPENLIASNPSFEKVEEDGTVSGWTAEVAGSAILESVEEQGLPEGRRAVAVRASGAAPRGFLRVLNADTFNLEAGEAIELRASVHNEGFRAAGVEVLWYLRSSDGEQMVGESFTPLVSSGNHFRTVQALVSPPPGVEADFGRVAIFAEGQGRVVVDGVSAKKKPDGAPETLSLQTEVGGRRLRVDYDRSGCLTLSRTRSDIVAGNVRFARWTDQGIPMGQLVASKTEVPEAKAAGIGCGFSLGSGSRSAAVDHRAELKEDGSLVFTWQLVAGGQADSRFALIFELDPGTSDLLSTVFEGAESRVQRSSLSEIDGVTGDEWQFGQQAEQVCFVMSAPVQFELLEPERSRAGLQTLAMILPPKFPGSVFRLTIRGVSVREEERITKLFDDVAQKRAELQGGSALELLDRIGREFPWRDDLRPRLEQARREIREDGERSMAELQAIRRELSEFPSSPILDLFRERAELLQESFAGTPFAEQAREIAGQVEGEVEQDRASRRSTNAQQMMRLAQSHLDANRLHWASFYCKRVLELFAGTEEARNAKHMLDIIAVRN